MTDSTTNGSTHTEHENDAWTINIGDHPGRADTPLYGRSRKHMISAVQDAQPWIFGPPPYQDHHGGGVWVIGTDGLPAMYLLPAGIEWSAQFCADPAKVDVLRRNAAALVDAFPGTRNWYTATLRMSAADLAILTTPITDAAGVAVWTDSFWNASVPLPQSYHTGMPPKAAPGYHHAPKPIVDIRTFVQDDFVLFPKPGVAVLPVAPRGSGDGRVAVAWVESDYHAMMAALNESAPLTVGDVLPADHPVARAAFVHQEN